jgi:hypothetical protein
MTLENYLQETGAFATLTGIMAGFALSAVIQLLATHKEGKLITATIIVFATSAVMFIYCLIVFVLLFAAAAELNAVPTDLDTMGSVALLIIFAALFDFLAGIGLSGWIRSKTAGIMTSVFAVISMCMTAYVIFRVITLFG